MRRPIAAVGSALFFLVAPGVAVGLIPWLLTRWQAHESLPYYWGPVRMIGMILLLAGLIVLVGAFARFVMVGLGTPAPVAAPERLVVGEAFILGRLALLLYATVLWLITAAFVRFYEDPTLPRRFGADYEAYRRAVPAWWPQLSPWKRYNQKLWIEDFLLSVVYLPFEQSNGEPTLARRREGVHRCRGYIRLGASTKDSCSLSTGSPEPEPGECSPKLSKPRWPTTSRRPENSGMSRDAPWWFATATPESVRFSWEPGLWRSRLRGSTTRGWRKTATDEGS